MRVENEPKFSITYDTQENAKRLKDEGAKGSLQSYKCDVGNEDEVEQMFEWIEKNLGGVDVCVNNAGFGVTETLLGRASSKCMRHYCWIMFIIEKIWIFSREQCGSHKEHVQCKFPSALNPPEVYHYFLCASLK